MSGIIYRNARPVTLGVDLVPVAQSLYVGATGDVTVVVAHDGTTVTFKAVPAGTILPVTVKKVTAGTDIVALNN